MKSETNRALWAKKKNYNQPIVETERLEITGQTLCTSTQFGGGTSGLGDPGDPITGN